MTKNISKGIKKHDRKLRNICDIFVIAIGIVYISMTNQTAASNQAAF